MRSKLRKQKYTCDGSLAKTKIYIFLLCFVLYLRAISKFKTPVGAYIRRDYFTEDFLRYEYVKYGGLYLEGLNFGILRYFPENLRCRLTYYESKNFSGSSLHHIFESENFRFLIL